MAESVTFSTWRATPSTLAGLPSRGPCTESECSSRLLHGLLGDNDGAEAPHGEKTPMVERVKRSRKVCDFTNLPIILIIKYLIGLASQRSTTYIHS